MHLGVSFFLVVSLCESLCLRLCDLCVTSFEILFQAITKGVQGRVVATGRQVGEVEG